MSRIPRPHTDVPLIPLCCGPHRTAAFDAIAVAIANDVRSNYAALLDHSDGCGWPHDDAVSALRETYASWLVGLVEDAVAFGVGLLELEVAA